MSGLDSNSSYAVLLLPHPGSFPLVSFQCNLATNPYVRKKIILKQEDANTIKIIAEVQPHTF